MLIPIVCISLLAYADSVLPSAYDVVIHEIMPRPSPVVGLPPCEYIELRNRSNHMVQLQDWRIAVNKREVTLPAYTLLPDSLVVLCGAAAADSAGIHNIMGIGRFPVLPDDSGLVVLYNNSRKVIHAVAYNPSWYGVSRNGKAGYSLEMADANCPCTGKSAWNAAPGSPGRYNTSVVTVAGFSGPDLYYAAVTDSQQLSICFNMAIDSVTAGDPARYQLSGNRITGATVLPPLFNTVRLQTASPLQPGNTYIITTKGITDCLQKHTGIKTAIALALPQLPTPQDVVFNEILPDPPTEIPEFIELYNRSSKAISLQELRVCARRQDGTLDTRRIISTDGRLLMPGHMVALTIDAELLCSYYNCRERENIQVTGRLPSMPGNAGRLVLLRYDSVIIDELPYSAAMHHTLVSESKGVSLERLEVNRLADVPGNWTSAGNGGATPGYRNSQQWPVAVNDQHIRLEPDIFSPDNDGIDDRAILALEMPGPGWVANVTVFDANGRPVRSLARNLLLGNKETLYWDGLGEKTLVLPPGIYIFFVEIYSTDGQVIRRKKTIAMARKLK